MFKIFRDFYVTNYIVTISDKMMTKKSPKFYCNYCDYNTSKKSDYNKHLSTYKHKNSDNSDINSDNLSPKVANFYTCECGNNYKFRQGLSYHKKKCNIILKCNGKENNDETEIKILTNLVLDVVKQNQELTNKIVDIYKVSQTNNITTNNNNINSHNKTFNLNVFLNETCKDAMNLSEFIENISLQLSDLESIGKLGYVEGISKIIMKNLNALEVEKRPLHCTDKKREIMYVKDEDEWQKEEHDKKHIRSVISSIVSKNLELLPEYENKYPECMNPESKKSDEYNKIIMETMGGGVNVGEKNKEKIIRRIAKEVMIDK